VDCMVALPGQLFYSTQISACLWFIARDKQDKRFRNRRGETLFIDARKLGTLVDRVHAPRAGTMNRLSHPGGPGHKLRPSRGERGVFSERFVPRL
jgi:type I restriction enzyme M protein